MSHSGKVSRSFKCFVYQADFSVRTHWADWGKGRKNSNLFKLSECDTDHVTRNIDPLYFKRYKDDFRVIFVQWPKLHLGLDVLSNQEILKGCLLSILYFPMTKV